MHLVTNTRESARSSELSGAAPTKHVVATELDDDPGLRSGLEKSLDKLLAICCGDEMHPRTVVMMEVPVMFGKWLFAQVQRRLARLHGVILVPKRVLASIVLSRRYTGPDGLHLSQAGHDRFAEMVRPWMGFD